MRAPRAVVDFFDPAGALMASGHPRGHRRGRPAKEEEGAAVRARLAEVRAMHERAVADIGARFGHVLVAKAAELAGSGRVTVVTDVGTLTASIARFRWGSSVLVSHAAGAGHSRAAKTRLTRPQAADPKVLTGYLVREVAALGPVTDAAGGQP